LKKKNLLINEISMRGGKISDLSDLILLYIFMYKLID